MTRRFLLRIADLSRSTQTVAVSTKIGEDSRAQARRFIPVIDESRRRCERSEAI